MSEITTEDSFTSAAGKQLLIFAALAIGGIGLLMIGLSWASSLTGASSGGNNAVDPASNSIERRCSSDGIVGGLVGR